MKFLTPYETRPKFKGSNVGSREYKEAKVVFSPDGNMSLEYGKIRNRQDEINSYAASCDVNMLVKRYQNGDQMALLRDNTGAYADLSSIPKNIHEAQRLSRNVHDLYNGMGDDIKLAFPTIEEFTSVFSSQTKFNDFINVIKKRQPVKKNVKKEDKVDA